MSTRQNINIAILGTVSAGKSTLLNTIYVSQYSDMKIKRTTMQPQVYLETNDYNVSEQEAKQIKEMNEQLNKQLIDKTEKGEELTIDDIGETNYYVPKVHKLVNLVENVYLSVYDIPGLNDFRTKDVYFEYINRNFHKFDIIFYVIDVNSALNTSDEKDIIEMILNNIKKNKENYNVQTKLMILLNKCDGMFLREGKMILDDEYTEMFNQVKTTVEQKVTEIHSETIYNIIPISAEDSYIYRMYDRNPDAKLDDKHINKFGLNEFGKRLWNQLNDEQKHNKIKEIMSSLDLNDTLTITGFNKFRKILSKYLKKTEQHKYLLNHILYDTSTIEMPSEIIFDITKLKNIYDKNIELNKMFNIEESNDVDTFITNLWQHYNDNLLVNYTEITDDNYDGSIDVLQFLNKMIDEFKLITNIVDMRDTLSKNIDKYYIDNINKNEKPFNKLYTFINNLLTSLFSKKVVNSDMVYKMFSNNDTLQMTDDEVIAKLEHFENENIINTNQKRCIIYHYLLNRYKNIHNGTKFDNISSIQSYVYLVMKFWDRFEYGCEKFQTIMTLNYWAHNNFKNMIETIDNIQNMELKLEHYYINLF
jgi:predicted GTPase